MLGTFAHIVRNEGLRGMYNGVSRVSNILPFLQHR